MNDLVATAQPDLQKVRFRFKEKTRQPAMRVLTLTPFYPTASDDANGCFVAEPLRAIGEFGVDSCVVAVQPLHRISPGSDAITPIARWIRYPCIPGGIGLAPAGAFLHASLISKVRRLHRSQRIDLIHAHAA